MGSLVTGEVTVESPCAATPFDRTSPLFAAVAGVLLGALAATIPEGLATAVRAAPFLVAAVVDVKTRRIPNALTVGALALALTAAVLEGWGGDAAVGAIVVLAAGLVLHLLARGAFGMGDVKLMAGAGAVAGLAHAVDFLFTMAFAGGLLALLFVLIHRSRRTTMPYGPAIAAGVVIVLLVR